MIDPPDYPHEPPLSHWRNPAVYDEVLEREFLQPLEVAAAAGGVQAALQDDLLRRLHWYFSVDGRERAPTMTLTAERAPAFHALVARLMRHISPAAIAALDAAVVSVEVKHVLLSYLQLTHQSAAVVDACDHEQGLVRVSYYLHGAPPAETWLLDGEPLQPAYAKYRGCRYFHQLRLRQRTVWLPYGEARRLSLQLDGQAHALSLSPASFDWPQAQGDTHGVALAEARREFPAGKGGRRQPRPGGLSGLKARVLLALARLPLVRRHFRAAWVFVDRDVNADDNAEHLYRWVRQHHPEINAWFLLNRDSPDWGRLKAEGVRLLPPGFRRKLLTLNARHIVSSHTDYAFGGMDRVLYGQAMRWQYSFLQHGVSMHDLHHWLGPCNFDCFITSSPAEYESIVADDSGYPYTAKEVVLTGLPRHDRLLRLNRQPGHQPARTLLVMPTWRAGVFEENMRGLGKVERQQAFAQTQYARTWKSLLHNRDLHALLERHGWRLVFMPHSNTLPYLAFFELPAAVEAVTSVSSSAFVDAGALLTDYTSVAFEMALLRKPVFYYQFDREFFYGGGHNWRPGYFDYDRDGFGPVALDEATLLAQLERFLAQGGEMEAQYLARQQRAMPLQDEGACERVYQSILRLRQPWAPRPAAD